MEKTPDPFLHGLVAAPYTPFDSNGQLRLGVVEKQAARLIETGVTGAFVCGTTGEGPSITTAERMAVLNRWVEVAGSSLKVIAHVGHNSQRDAVALAEHAGRAGAAAIGAMPPFFFKPSKIEQVVDFMKPVAAAAGPLPFYYYHIPSMTGVSFPMVDLVRVAGEQIPSFRGVKFTHSDLMDYQRCLSFDNGRYEIAWGLDEMLLGALAVGAQAAVGSTYNYAAGIYTKMIEAHSHNDLVSARACARKSGEMVAVLLKYGVLRTGKAAMAMIGIDCGPTLPPVPPLNTDEMAAVRQAFERIGIL